MFCLCAKGGVVSGFALGLIVLMSLRPAIPQRVALLHCSPPLHQPFVIVNRVAGTVNHHLTRAGEFSTGTLGNFQPELTYLTKIKEADVRKAIEKLPAVHREVIVLREFEQLSYAEIAQILDCRPGTVVSRLSRAREKLRYAAALELRDQ